MLVNISEKEKLARLTYKSAMRYKLALFEGASGWKNPPLYDPA